MDAHHFVPKRVIASQLVRRAPLAAALTDTRNGVALCRHHHDLVEQGRANSPRPTFLDYFLVEHGLYERTGSVRGLAEVRRPQK